MTTAAVKLYKAEWKKNWRKKHPEKRREVRKKWKVRHREKFNAHKKANYARGRFGKGRRRIYSFFEDVLIREHAIPDRLLAEKIKRSVESIQIRRSRLARTK